MKDFNERFQQRLTEAKKKNLEYGFFFAYDEVVHRWDFSKEERKKLLLPFITNELEKITSEKKKKGFIEGAYSFLRIKEEFNEILVKIIDIKFEEVINVYKGKKYGIFLALNNLDKSIREVSGDKNFPFDKKAKIKEELLSEFQDKTYEEIQNFINKDLLKGLAEILNQDLIENLIEFLNEILIDNIFEESLIEYQKLDSKSAIFLALGNLDKKVKEVFGDNNYKFYHKKVKIKKEFLKELEGKTEIEEKEFINQLNIFREFPNHKDFTEVLIDIKFEKHLIEMNEIVSWGLFESFNKLVNSNTSIIKEVTGNENCEYYDKKAKIRKELLKELEGKTEKEKKEFINKGLLICAGNLDTLQVLIEEFGADILHRQAGAPFFFLSSTFPQCLEVLEYVSQKEGTNRLKEKDEEGNTIFFSMVNGHNGQSRNLSKIFEFLLEKGVDPFEKNEEGISAFDRAKELKQNELIYLFQKTRIKKKELRNLNYLDLSTSKKNKI